MDPKSIALAVLTLYKLFVLLLAVAAGLALTGLVLVVKGVVFDAIQSLSPRERLRFVTIYAVSALICVPMAFLVVVFGVPLVEGIKRLGALGLPATAAMVCGLASAVLTSMFRDLPKRLRIAALFVVASFLVIIVAQLVLVAIYTLAKGLVVGLAR